MLASPLRPSFLDIYRLSMLSLKYKALCVIISFLVLCSVCGSSSFVHFENGPLEQTRCLSLWLDSCSWTWFRKVFSFFWDTLFFFFFIHLHLFDGVHFQYSQVFVRFFSSKCSDFFLIWLLYSFRYLSFSASYYSQGTCTEEIKLKPNEKSFKICSIKIWPFLTFYVLYIYIYIYIYILQFTYVI